MFTSSRLLACSLALVTALTVSAGAVTPNVHDAEKTITENERQWCDFLATGDNTAPKRFIADDFVGVASDGTQYNKQQAIDDLRDSAKQYRSNRLDQIKVRFFGDTAVAKGDEVWELRSGEHRHGRFVWTDVWVLRNGQWQIVAAEAVKVLDPEK
jgi:hypothetical protein